MNKIWSPNQRCTRTAIQVVLTVVTLLATLAAISAAISRVMAIPAIDEWLRKFGAGSAPAGAIAYTPLNRHSIGLTRRQYRAMVDGDDTGEKD
ncbi:hypothetical protein [Microbacterium sp. NPDC056052]|uniref:hypothetical protein n=1 Tax=Microbacterium sp. NPDC056052 TaxID=3345695 RepID=UPI0035E30EDA